MKPSVGAIVFFDLPGSTRAMKDPHAAVPRMISHNSLCGAITRLNKGTIVKDLGDGLMVRFDNAGDAVVCGRSISGLRMFGAYRIRLPRECDRRGCTVGCGSGVDWSSADSSAAAGRPHPPCPSSTAGYQPHPPACWRLSSYLGRHARAPCPAAPRAGGE